MSDKPTMQIPITDKINLIFFDKLICIKINIRDIIINKKEALSPVNKIKTAVNEINKILK